jgi:tetratricopeptide (TPR) repeat protein
MSDFPRRLPLIVLGLGATLVLGACTSSVTGPGRPLASSGLGPSSRQASIYGLFLAGQSAINSGRSREAADYFVQAQGLDKANAMLAQRAFTAALLAGDVSTAARMASLSGEGAEPAQNLGILVQAVDGLATGKPKGAKAAFDRLSQKTLGPPYQGAADMLLPFAAAGAGDWDAALALPAVTGDRFVAFFVQLNQAQLMEQAGRADDAAAVYRTMLASADAGTYVTQAYGAFLERQGRPDEAMALYDAALSGDANDGGALAAKARVMLKKPAPPLPGIQKGAASTMMACAIAAASQRQPQGSLVFLRLALRLNPALDEAWLLVGDIMTGAKDTAGAAEAFAHIGAASPQYAEARGRMAWALQREGHPEAAMSMAYETVKALPDDVSSQATLADILRANERFEDSITVMDGLIAKSGETVQWGYYFMRGVALERVGRWEPAEADLKKALALNPTEPEIMNYLAYSWIDRGQRLQDALAMIRKAVEARPDSGAMIDSLGWAYFRLGDFTQAVEMLEQAVQIEAADPDVNNHLGDAYWRVGRKVEARFQWSRVLTLTPTAKIKAEAEGKLINGLPELTGPPAPPVPPPPPRPLRGGGTRT